MGEVVTMKLRFVCGLLFLAVAVSAVPRPRSIKSNAVTRLKRSDTASDVLVHRQRRQAQPLTPGQKTEIVEHHNVLRANEGADNMELMKWSDFLASLAVSWAADCNFVHGQPPLGNNPPYTEIGQNLFAVTAGNSAVNLTAGIQAWFDEKIDYNLTTLECADHKVCGHYTQVVWSSSREVGCGYHLCSTIASTSLTNAYYFVCNYGPPGNVDGQQPYTKGPACSKCGSGAGWCKNGLCNSDCSSQGPNCSCSAICFNCASLNDDTCRCSCADGWHGTDCSVVCENTNSQCNANPGWPPSWCNHNQYGSAVREGCPVMCNLCTPDASAVPHRCPPIIANGTDVTFPLSTPSSATVATTTAAAASARYITMASAVLMILLCSFNFAVAM